MTKIALQESWQGGPASIEVECDEITLDSGANGIAVLFKIETPIDPTDGAHIELGTGKIDFPAGHGRLEFWVAGSLEQARELRDALSAIIADEAIT